MIRRAALLGMIAAASLVAPLAPALSLTIEDARHLLVRVGFAASLDDVVALRPLDRAAAVTALLNGVRETAVSAPPGSVGDWYQPNFKKLSAEQRRALRRKMSGQVRGLKAWWYGEMIATPSPLAERMTLFWHNHFTSSSRVVRHPALLYRQNALLRRHALGNFGDLLREIGRDPAMMIYLNTVQNQKAAPNENYARELLELFTLGEGNYTEQDIKQVARAYTGWIVDRKTGEAVFRARRHDGGQKQIFGQQGHFDADDVVDLLLAQPRTAELIVEKLWRAFVSDTPDGDEVLRLAEVFRLADYELRPLVEALLTGDDFWSAGSRGGLIKSPVDLIVGTVRQFDLPIRRPMVLVKLGRRLGQDIFDPPNVKGWPGGRAWITSKTLLARSETMTTVVGDSGMGDALGLWVDGLRGEWVQADNVRALLVAAQPVDFSVLDLEASGALVRRLLTDPTYQLK
ncbi:MAG: DUF1800 domain-containing protein [Alphaproteobacteria bacterium]